MCAKRVTSPPRRPITERFSEKYQIDPRTGCWNWTACKDKHGYGHISLGGKHGGHALAHRVSYEIHVGQIPDGMGMLHSCDNPACVNPRHLRPGTQVDNVRDMEARQRGNNYGKRKLSTAQVTEIRRLIAAGEKQCVIARKFSIGESHITRIKKATAWRNASCA